MISIFILTTRGLEDISAQELAALPGFQQNELAYRRVAGTLPRLTPELLALRTVDDAFLHLATWEAIPAQRAALAELQRLAGELPVQRAASLAGELRRVAAHPTFSVTASFVGKRNYSAPEIKSAVAQGVTAQAGWQYSEEDAECDFNIRVFIEHAVAQVGLRIAAAPLYRRAYKHASLPGSLKPSTAATLVRLAAAGPAGLLVDPMCGAGTIPIEAALSGWRALAGDLDPEAVEAARANAANAFGKPGGPGIAIARWDAHRLPLAAGSIDAVVSNLPWGRQVTVDEALAAFYRSACAEIERILAPGGRAVLLTSVPELARFQRLQPVKQIEISLFGQNPSVMVAEKEMRATDEHG